MNEEQIVIKSKLESISKISELGINKFSEELFNKGEESRVLEFIKNNPAKYYAIRDKSKAGGVFKLKVLEKDVLNEISNYDLYTINVSSANYGDNQLLVGEIEILSNGEVYAILSTKKGYSVRDAISEPEFNLKTDIFDDKTLNNIPYFDYLYSYIVEHGLQDVIVEFSLFDIDVGINKEKIVIYELRTHY